MTRDNDAYTHPNQRKAGISTSWRNARGQRVQTAQTVTRDKRVAEIRAALVDRPDMTAPSVALRYGVSMMTAREYLAMAREAAE